MLTIRDPNPSRLIQADINPSYQYTFWKNNPNTASKPDAPRWCQSLSPAWKFKSIVSSLSLQINQWLLFMIYETKFATRTYRKMKYTTTRMLSTTNTIILIVVPLYQFHQAKLRRLFFFWNTEWNRYHISTLSSPVDHI
jgi:hypothetical protein